jgi:fused signal recognition particle receptor
MAMFDFFKKKPIVTETPPEEVSNVAEVSEVSQETGETPTKMGLFARLKSQLTKSREAFTSGLSQLFLGKKQIDDELLEELETLLLQADVGFEATTQIIDALTEQVSRQALKDPQALFEALASQLEAILTPVEQALVIDSDAKPHVVLMVGINGAGKTTTIGKLAKYLQRQQHQVMLAAGDTFRAAAVEQLQTWGERNQIAVMAQKTGADSAAVIFDAIHSAQAKNLDVLLADTAGRLHTQHNLMDELKKVKRVIQKCDADAPHDVLLVLDASIGQNAINQAKQFHEAVGVTGLVITKLDGTAKGGVIFNLAQTLGLPVKFIGVGEKIDDLQVFNAKAFVDAFLDRPASEH